MRIAHFGTFDVENYGDLLFPVVAKHFLAPVATRFDFVSPLGGPPVCADAERNLGVLDIDWASFEFDMALIGGGNIIACRPTGLPIYAQRPGLGLVAYSALWSAATTRAAQCGAAVAWNAPGLMHREWSDSQRHVLKGCVGYSDYVAFREADYISDLLQDPKVGIVPDTVIALSNVWTIRGLIPSKRKNEAKWKLGGGYFVFHAKKRNLNSAEMIHNTANRVSQFAIMTGLKPVLLAIGRCHGDHEILTDVSRAMSVDHVLADTMPSLRQVTALIAHAGYVFSASLHGAIVAASYGVPVNAWGISLPKYRALFEGHLGAKGVVVDSVDALTPKALVAATKRAAKIHTAVEKASTRVREHFKRIATIEGRKKDRARQVADLKAHMTAAMESKSITRVLPLETLI